MKRVGIIGTDNGHAHSYCALINGWSDAEPLPLRNGEGPADPGVHVWGHFLRAREADGLKLFPDMKVTKIWSDDQQEASRIARACSVPEICARPDDVASNVDAVMVLSQRPELHFEHAKTALEFSLPTYIDKPMAPSSNVAREIFEFADEHRAPCFSGSAARYSPELLAVRDVQCRIIGETRAVYIHCPISVPLYFVHALEMMALFVGCEIQWVQVMEGKDRQVVLLEEATSISVVIDHINIGLHPRYSGSIHGSEGYLPFTMSNTGQTMFAFLQEFRRFIDTGVPPSTSTDTIRLMAISEAALISLNTRERVSVN